MQRDASEPTGTLDPPAFAYARLTAGEPAPWFKQRSIDNPTYAFDTAAGRPVLLCFFGGLQDAHAGQALTAALRRRDLFDDVRASFFGVTHDPRDGEPGRLRNIYPGYRFVLDFDGTVGKLYGALPLELPPPGAALPVRRLWVVLDAAFRVRAVIPFAPDQSDIDAAIAQLAATPPAGQGALAAEAPVLLLPDVFERDFCETLVAVYERNGGLESGFMRQIDGRTHLMHDHQHKRRRDHVIGDPGLIRETQARFKRRILPQIERIFHFSVTRMERYIVACYDATEQGHFRPHRDNTTSGTAHRKFAVSINLNDGFEGGEVWFPEYGPRAYRAPPGAALVFSCSLLHAVHPMRRGRRYAFLPFLYDDAAARIREANNAALADDVAPYSAGTKAAPSPSDEAPHGAA